MKFIDFHVHFDGNDPEKIRELAEQGRRNRCMMANSAYPRAVSFCKKASVAVSGSSGRENDFSPMVAKVCSINLWGVKWL